MEILIELLKIVLPAALVLYAMFLTMRSTMIRDIKTRTIDLKAETLKIVMPLKLQAYERMCLYLERISPGNMLPRLNEPGLSASAFQRILVQQIREELTHNLSQQVYMSSQAWSLIKSTSEDIISMINTAARKAGEDGKSTDLAKELINLYVAKSEDPINSALDFIKDEIHQQI